MAGRPARRAEMQAQEAELKSVRQQYVEHVRRIHVELIKRGIDPKEIDGEGYSAARALSEYDPALPLAIMRLSGAGQSLEEIRESLGFNEGQEREWVERYVDFAEATARARAREEAFWLKQMRQAAAAGDRTSVASIQSLISKRFQAAANLGDASQLVHVHIGQPLDKRTLKDG